MENKPSFLARNTCRAIAFAIISLTLYTVAMPVFAQSKRGGLYLGLSVSHTPLHGMSEGGTIQLTQATDLSPQGSFIHYPAEKVNNTLLTGFSVAYRPIQRAGITWRGQLETSVLYRAITHNGPKWDYTTLELGVGYFVPFSKKTGIEVGIAGVGTLLAGKIGKVSKQEGDGYLISAKDKERYAAGSTIHALGGESGVDATLSA